MDSEQLVCNPFQDLQSEVMSEAQKKASLTEKLTSVKNNVCENHFAMARAQLERNKSHILKQLHDRSSKLRYEVSGDRGREGVGGGGGGQRNLRTHNFITQGERKSERERETHTHKRTVKFLLSIDLNFNKLKKQFAKEHLPN